MNNPLQPAVTERVLLIGYGDIARRVQQQLPDHYESVGVRRSEVEAENIVSCDMGDAEQVRSLLDDNYDAIVVTLTPDEISPEGYERAYLQTARNLAAALQQSTDSQKSSQPRLVLWISSTSVYGQQNGEWVDELSPMEATGYAGKTLREAEAVLASADINAVQLRCSGIYGPGRQRLIDQVRDGKGCAQSPVLWTNRIHADDVAGVIIHLLEMQRQGRRLEASYLATDCEPVALWDVKHWLAAEMGLAENHLAGDYPAGRRGSKRCSNRRLLEAGYQFKYPTFREGYRQVLEWMAANKQ